MSDQAGLIVRNGKVLLPDGEIYHGDLRLQDGKIRQIGSNLRGGQEINAAGGHGPKTYWMTRWRKK